MAMVEAAPPPGLGNLASLGRMAVNAPDLMLDGIGYVAALRWSQIPVIHAAIDRIDAGERLAVTLTNGQRYRADVVCMGYGFCRPMSSPGCSDAAITTTPLMDFEDGPR